VEIKCASKLHMSQLRAAFNKIYTRNAATCTVRI